MKKFGFTLAEVLITLAIIGVVAAMTLPVLTQNTRNAQVGPKLAKAVSMFEQANQAMLEAQNLTSLQGGNFWNAPAEEGGPSPLNGANYANALSNHFKISQLAVADLGAGYDFRFPAGEEAGCSGGFSLAGMQSIFQSKDGIVYFVRGDRTPVINADSEFSHQRQIGNVAIDIDGGTGLNNWSRDIFAFTLWADGSLRPVGMPGWNGGLFVEAEGCLSRAVCPTDGGAVTDRQSCTGSIFQNNLRVLYN